MVRARLEADPKTCAPRIAAPTEAPAAIAVWKEANPHKRGGHHPRRLAAWANLPGARLAIIGNHSAVVAMALGLPGREDKGEGELIPEMLHLTGICVRPSHQGQGLGHTILEFLLADGRALGYRVATLWTNTDNLAAQRLFERHGFVPTGLTDVDEFGTPMIHMRAGIAL